MKKRTVIIFMISVIAIILVLLAILMYNLNKNTDIGINSNTEVKKVTYNVEDTIPNNILQTNSSSIRISPNASIIFSKYYRDCGHTVKVKEDITNDMVNMSQDEFNKLYSDWQINKFTSTEIELFKEFPGTCGEHYLVRSNNGYVCIYNIKDDNSFELKESTDIAVKYLANDDISELEKGVILYGKENLNSYIENFE